MRVWIDTYKSLLLWLFLCCLSIKVHAAGRPYTNSWKLVTPAKGSTIKSGELLVTIKLMDSVTIARGTFIFFLDDYLITSGVKFSKDKISILYLQPLKPGKHKIQVKGKAAHWNFYMDDINAEFYVGAQTEQEAKRTDSIKKSNAPKTFELSGNISGLYKSYNVTGPGKAQLQNPPYLGEENIAVVGRIGKVSFPVRYFNTTDNYTYGPAVQPRNFFQAGVMTPSVSLLYGDMNPLFDRLVLTGSRIRGVDFSVTRPRFQMHLINGTLQQAIEGQLIRYDASLGPPPPNLRPDSTYINPGVYRRNVTAGRFSFGNPREGSTLSLDFLRARDEINSIHYGYNPKDNLVVGLDEAFITNGSAMKVNIGGSFSLVTNDISQGAITDKDVDSITGTHYGINPKAFRDVFIFNNTSIWPGKSSMAGYATGIFHTSNQVITIDYHRIGAAYQSFGNPYLRNDQESASVQDQFSFWKRRVLLTGRYLFQENDLTNNEFNTITTNGVTGSLFLMPGIKLPQIGFVYFTQYRLSDRVATNLANVDDRVTNYTATFNYLVLRGKFSHGINFQFNQSIRADQINSFNNNIAQTYSGGFSELYIPARLGLDVRYTTMNLSTPESGKIPMSQGIDARLHYEWRKIKTVFSAGGYLNQYFSTILSGASQRGMYNASISYRGIPGAIFDVEAGYSPYTDLSISNNNYTEMYGLVRVTYNFDWKRN